VKSRDKAVAFLTDQYDCDFVLSISLLNHIFLYDIIYVLLTVDVAASTVCSQKGSNL
jgi:hypothetical protein